MRRLAAGWLAAFAAGSAAAALPPDRSGSIEMVVVTATRHAEFADKVPESVGVLTADRLEALDIKDFSDAVVFLPGVTFDPASNAISIRGINSTAGAGTTGIYIDDVPIQMRSLDYSSNNTLPAVFDLDRIEVLRGPQGTLFGAGAEGGAVRYITEQPDMTQFGGHARAQTSVARNGAMSYEAGAAFGGPLTDGLAFRVSAWDRHDGGTIGKIDPATADLTRNNANAVDTLAVHGALAWTPTERLTLTLRDFRQDRIRHDTDTYWLDASGHGTLRSGTPEALGDRDHFNLVSLKAEYDFGGAELISDTAYFTRFETVQGYSGTLYNLSYFQQLLAAESDPMGLPCTAGQCAAGLYPLLTAGGFNLPGFGTYRAVATVTNRQENFTQELRLQSTYPAARLVWTVGLFYGADTQHSSDIIADPQLAAITTYLWGEDLVSAWGEGLLAGDTAFVNSTVAHDLRLAAYVNAAFAVTDALKVQAGVRLSHTRYDFRNFSDGPENFGYESGAGRKPDNPITMMAGIVYTPDDASMLYATYATGYRIGGANAPFPQASCQADLDALGLTGVPQTYNSDRVASFELGSKNRFLGGRLELQGSAYRLTWSHMQQPNYLSSCGFQYIANFGAATSTGFDLEADWMATDTLQFHLGAGYMDAHFTHDSMSGSGPGAAIIAHRGDSLPGSPWTVAVEGLYRFDIAGQPVSARADYEYASHNGRLTPQTDPATTQYDPGLVNDPATGVAALRFETTVRQALVTLFAENLFDSQPQLGLTHQDRYTLLYEASTLRPRTVGVSLSYRY
jgi:iron complex outermembrane recepter protein